MAFRREALDIRHRLPDHKSATSLLEVSDNHYVRGVSSPGAVRLGSGARIQGIAAKSKRRDHSVVGQFEFFFLYGPRFAGSVSAASTSPTISLTSQRRSEMPAAIAGDMRSFECIRTKL